jgi:CheY-like chemotaxis protein
MIVAVEDPFICRLLAALLTPHGYAVVATGASRAIEVLRAAAGSPVLVTNAPGKFLEFAAQVPLLYLAATPDDSLAARFRSCRVLRKPFRPKELLAALDELGAAGGAETSH